MDIVTFEPIMQFRCFSRFRIRRTISTHPILWRRKKLRSFGHNQQLQLLWHTYTHTHRQTDMPTLWPTQHRGPSWWKNNTQRKSYKTCVTRWIMFHHYFCLCVSYGALYLPFITCPQKIVFQIANLSPSQLKFTRA